MVYKEHLIKNTEILDEGVYDGFHYVILSLGSHPCAYIELPNTHKYYGKDYYNIPIYCHGGLTYSSNEGIVFPKDNLSHRDGYWIGWDYAHYGDFCYYGIPYLDCGSFDKKWTTEEILKEVKDVIEQLK